jgi:hypothetical protein
MRYYIVESFDDLHAILAEVARKPVLPGDPPQDYPMDTGISVPEEILYTEEQLLAEPWGAAVLSAWRNNDDSAYEQIVPAQERRREWDEIAEFASLGDAEAERIMLAGFPPEDIARWTPHRDPNLTDEEILRRTFRREGG